MSECVGFLLAGHAKTSNYRLIQNLLYTPDTERRIGSFKATKAMVKLIRAANHTKMQWKNGGGTTVEIASFPAGSSLDSFEWRLSMATVGKDGPFSEFEYVDRTLFVLAGKGIYLTPPSGKVLINPDSEPLIFRGDDAIEGHLVDGEIIDLNIMTRRTHWTHTAKRFACCGEVQLDTSSDVQILFVEYGKVLVLGKQAKELQERDTLLVDAYTETLSLLAIEDASLIVTALSRAGSR